MSTPEKIKANAQSIKYIKILRTFLWTVGGWPGEIFDEEEPLRIKSLRKYIPIQSVVVVLGQFSYIAVYSNVMDVFTMGNCFVTTFLTCLTAIRTSLPNFKSYSVITRNFLMSVHLVHFNHKSEYSTKMYAKVEKYSYYLTIYAMTLMIMATLFFNLPAFYINYKAGVITAERNENTTYEFAVIYIFPGFHPDDHYIFTTLFNFILTYSCAVGVSGVDTLLSLMVFQLIGHIQILRYDLENMPKPKKQILVKGNDEGQVAVVEMYDEEENEVIHKLLTEYVDHHRLISNFAADMTEFFGPLLAINYLFQFVSCCLLLLEISQGDLPAIARFGPLTAIIFGQLIQISTIFEVIATVSEKLVDSVYWTPWECMNTRNRRTMGILLHRLQTPIRVFAMGLTPVGVTTMAGILKTTFTYYAFLRSSSEA